MEFRRRCRYSHWQTVSLVRQLPAWLVPLSVSKPFAPLHRKPLRYTAFRSLRSCMLSQSRICIPTFHHHEFALFLLVCMECFASPCIPRPLLSGRTCNPSVVENMGGHTRKLRWVDTAELADTAIGGVE